MQPLGERSFGLNIKALKCIGVYPIKAYKNLHALYGVVLYILMMVPTVSFAILHFLHFDSSTNIGLTDEVSIGVSIFYIKFLSIFINKAKLKYCIHYFDNFVVTCDDKEIIEDCVNVCRRNSIIFMVGTFTGIMGFYFQVFQRGIPEEIPFKVWIPQIIKENLILYNTIYVCIILAHFYCFFLIGGLDPVAGGLCYLASAQIRILKNKLQHLNMYVLKHLSPEYSSHKCINHNLIYADIKKCVILYEEIFNFVKAYEECFSTSEFIQLSGSSTIIAFGCFQISKFRALNVTLVITLDSLLMTFIQIFFYCYYGNILVENHNDLCTAIYMSKWYEFDVRSKRALLILMERSNKPMVIKAGNLLELSLNTFTTILRRAYSIVAILKNITY